LKAWLYVITTGLIFGCGGLVSKQIIDEGLDPVFGTAVMMTITALCSIALYLRAGGVDARGWRLAMLAGALNAGLPAMLFNLGFEQLPASVNTLIISLGPVFTATTAHLVSHDDRFTAAKIVGLGASVAGVSFLAGSLTAAPIEAMALPLAGAALAGAGLLLVKRVSEIYRPAATLTPMMIGAAVAGWLATALFDRWQAAPAGHWLTMLILGAANVVAFGAVLAAAEIAPASQTSLSGYLIPLIGVVGGVWFFGEPLGWRLAIGGLLILSGVVLVGTRRSLSAPLLAGGP
jgi:drug/metabolite transporter (DMT)-like permease